VQVRHLIALPLILGCLWGCAPQRAALKPVSPAGQGPVTQTPPPILSNDQILGLQSPPGMIEDPDSGQYVIAEVMRSFWKLRDKAAQDGWHLILVSGHRSFKHQMRIWNHYDSLYKKTDTLDAKRRVRAVMSLVSVPGLSRHHWGTDMDISEASLRGQLVNVHPGTPARVIEFYNWMEHNAPQFGFCKVYLGKKGAVRDEPWHWSYFPYSRVYEQQFMAIQDFHKILSDQVDDVRYLMKNFHQVFKQETKSINTECDLRVQN
jgi:zinc D-Ala-D-Ala carboxypeptidase